MVARLRWYLDPLSFHQLKKNVVKVGPPLTKLSGYVHALGRSVACDYGIPGHSHLFFQKSSLSSKYLIIFYQIHARIQRGTGGLDPPPP